MSTQVTCNGCLSRVQSGLEKCPYCGYSFTNANPAGTLPSGTVLEERYTLGKCLSIDGEGIVYAAADGQTQRRVVIKEYVPVTICSARTRTGAVLPRPECEVLFKTTRMDFVDLYRALISIGPTDGMVRIYDLFEANNTAYAVREPDVGISLASYLQRRRAPLSVDETVELLRPVFYAVEAVHRKGVLHRGIAPETIFIAQDGSARLSGFATMGLRTADSELRSQLYNGFAAPEQYAAAEFDGKYTDVYSLGAVFYYALTKELPQAADRRRIEDALQPPRNVNNAVPQFVSSAVMRAMRMNTSERIQSAPLFLQAIVTPSNDDMPFHLSARQLKALCIAGAVLLTVGILSWLIILFNSNAEPKASSSQAQTSSQASSSTLQTVELPSFRGQQYTQVQKDFLDVCQFVIEEAFSSEYEEGLVIGQSPEAGSTVEIGTIVTLTVSRGPELLGMPDILGKPRTEVKQMLNEMGLKHNVFGLANDGSYVEDTVVRADVNERTYTPGMLVDPVKDTVFLYVAGAPPVSSSSVAVSPSPEPTPVVTPAPTPPPTPAPGNNGNGNGNGNDHKEDDD